jgi:tyrosine-specific transport protein
MTSKVFSGALLVAGTAIGAGMLAMPVATSLAGFLPACIIYLLCWLFMAGTGLLLLEICLWLPEDANMVSMAHHLLGKAGKILSWALYLFLFYCLTIAYVAGGGGFITSLIHVPDWLGILLFTLIFAPIVYFGTRAVDRFNLLLMVGLGVSYFVFVALGWKHVQVDLLKRMNFGPALLSLPVVFTAFSFQGVVPSLTAYLNRNAKKVRRAIIWGTSIPFFAYVVWELLILGIVPVSGENGLLAAQAQGQTAVFPLKHFVDSPYIYAFGQAFAFFALTTSFLGVTLGLLDFLADGLKWAKKGFQKSALCLFVFLPPTVIAISNPNIFIKALTYAGGIGCALLLGLLPILMVYVGRYRKDYSLKHQQFPGGKPILFCMSLFVLLELAVELVTELL